MKELRGTLMIRILALVICVMLLIGTLPAGAAFIDTAAVGDDPAEAAASPYYLTGSISDWGIDATYMFVRHYSDLNPEVEEYKLTVTLTATDEVKAVKSENAEDKQSWTWYPDGTNNNITGLEGTYSFFLRPNGDGNSDWIKNLDGKGYIFYVQEEDPEPGTEPGTEPSEPQQTLSEPVFTYDGTSYDDETSGKKFLKDLTVVTVDIPGDIADSVRAVMVAADVDMTGDSIYDPDADWTQPLYINSEYIAAGEYTKVTIGADQPLADIFGTDSPDGSIGVRIICTTGTTELDGSLSAVEEIIYPDHAGPVIGSVDVSDEWSNDKATLTVTVSDIAGVCCVKCGDDEAVFDSESGTYTVNVTEKKDYTITAEDNLGNQAVPVPVSADSIKIDKTKPVLTRVINDTYPDQWVNSETVNVLIQAVDEGGSLLDADSFTLDGNAAVPVADNGNYVFTLTAGTHTLKVCDIAGNESDALNITPKIDTIAPVKDDITVEFTSDSGAADKIWHVLSFGIYSNHDVTMTVRVLSNGLSPIKSVTAYNVGDNPISAEPTLIDGVYVAEFTLDFKDPYAAFQSISFTVTDEAGNTAQDEIPLTQVGIIANSSNLSDEAFEVIVDHGYLVADVSESISTVESYEDAVNAITYHGGAGKITVSAIEDVTGLDSVKIWFAQVDQFSDDLEPVVGLEPLISATSISANGKVVDKQSFDVNLTADLNGRYVLYSEVTNNSLNTVITKTAYCFDNTAPQIADPVFSSVWSNDKIEVTVSVADLPETLCSGVGAVTVKDESNDDVDVTDNGDGTYTFYMDQKQDYTISAADHLGNPASDVTIGKDSVHIDKNDDPQITEVVYIPQSYKDIEVTVKAQDQISSVKGVYAVNTQDADDRIDAVDNGNGEFKLTITAEGSNSYIVYAEDQAGNLSSGNEITTGIDRQTISVDSICFTGYQNIKSFGAYANAESVLMLTVALKKDVVSAPVNLAELASAQYTYGDSSPVAAKSIDAENLTASFEFVLSEEEETLSIDQLFGVQFEFANTYGYSFKGTLGALLSKETVEVSADSSVVANQDLFEVIVSKTNSSIEISSDSDKHVERNINSKPVLIHNGVDVALSAVIEDEICGVDVDSITAYFGAKDQFNTDGSPKEGMQPVACSLECEPDESSDQKVISASAHYTHPDNLTTGEYIFYVSALNLCGNRANLSYTVYVDTTLPEITDVTLSQGGEAFANTEWTNKKITVSYKIGDKPDAYYSGAAWIEVKGDKNHQNASPALISGDNPGSYSFDADYNQSYTIRVKDALNADSTDYTVPELRYDAEKPNFLGFRYGSEKSETISAIAWANAAEGIAVTFDVDDKSDGTSGAAGDVLSNIKSVVIIMGSVGDLSDEELMQIIENDAAITNYQLKNNADGTWTCSFTAHEFAQYTAIITDNAGNVTTAATSAMKVDSVAPVITKVTFEKAETASEKVLRCLTFGLYSNDDIKMTVEVMDAAPTSGVISVTSSYGELSADPDFKEGEADPDDATEDYTESVTFIITNPSALVDASIELTVTDAVGNSTTRKVNEIRADGKARYFDDADTNDYADIDNQDKDADFEIINTDQAATADEAAPAEMNRTLVIDDISVTFTNENYGYVLSPDESLTPVFSGKIDGTDDGVFETVITDELVGILDGGITVTFDGVAVDPQSVVTYIPDETGKITRAAVAYHTGVLTDGLHTIRIDIENNAGNTTSRTASVYVDNSAPVIDTLLYNNSKWRNQPFEVSFRAYDRPVGNNMFIGGIASITVTGDKNHQDYSPSEIDAIIGSYQFYADYNQSYTITVTDVFGRDTTVHTSELRFDTDAPNFHGFRYGSGESEDISAIAWANAADGIAVTFDVDDKTDGTSGVEGGVLSNIKSFVIIKGSVGDMTGDELKAITANDASVTNYQLKNNADGTWTCSFIAHEYAQYTAIITDNAGNVITATTTTMKVDNAAPVITKVTFEKAETAGEKILRYLTFGLYSNDDIKMTIEVMDSAPTSGVVSVTSAYGVLSADFDFRIGGADPDDATEDYTESVTFIITNPTALIDASIELTVTDAVGNATTRRVNEIRADGKVRYFDDADTNDYADIDNQDKDADFEIINTDDPADVAGSKEQQQNKVNVVDDISISFTNALYGYVVSPADDTTLVYSGKIGGTDDGVFESVITDELVGILDGGITVTFDGEVVDPEDVVTYIPDEVGKITQAAVAYHTGVLTDGLHTIRIDIENNAGNTTSRTASVYVDNTAPTISNVVFDNSAWKNDIITVTYDVFDNPADDNLFVGGIASITVTGDGNDANHRDYSPATFDKVSGTYSFDADYHQRYTITATDVFGRSVTHSIGSELLYDVDQPNIDAFRYGSEEAEDINNSAWRNKEDGMAVSFSANDFSNGISDDEGILLSDIKSVVIVKGSVEGKSSDELKAISQNDAAVDNYQLTNKTDGTWSCSFTAHEYAKYTAIITDYAGNVSTATTSTIKIDSEAPEITDITFVKDENAVQTVLRFLTFGLYHNDDIWMNVTVRDAAPSSGVVDVILTYQDEEFEFTRAGSFTVAQTDPDSATSEHINTVSFRLTKDEYNILLAGKMLITVTDHVSYQNASQGQSVASLYQLLQNHDEHSKASDNPSFEISAFTGAPDISDITLTGEFDYTDQYNDTVRHWFNGSNVTAEFTVSELKTKLHCVSVLMNDTDISEHLTSLVYPNASARNTAYSDTADHSIIYYTDGKDGSDYIKGADQRIESDSFTLRSDDYPEVPVRTISGENPANTIVVTAIANNGNSGTKEITYYIDDAAPIITAITFSGDSVETYNVDSGIVIGDSTVDPSRSFGYYFKEQTKVTVTASDLLTDDNKAVIGSGIKEIHFIAIDLTGDEVINTFAVNDANNSDDCTASFDVYANFRGIIYAYAVDKVGNEGTRFTPNNSIVEDMDEHLSGSDTEITIADSTTTFTGRQDNNGHDLYSGDVDVTLTVYDRYSGIGKIHYTVSNDNGIIDEATAVFNHDKSIDDDDPNAVWTYRAEDVINNIIKKATKTIHLDGDDRHNFNNIRISIDAEDRVGYQIASSELVISIDTTDPTIELVFDNDEGNVYEGEDKRYFKEHRVAAITVTERNFDPADFETLSEILNYEGPELAFVAQSNWSTDYTDYTDHSVHTAAVTFADDGDYKLELKYTDEAGNEAVPVDSEEFVIDNIDPTISVSYDNNSAQNENYYSAARTATVVITEHNFAEGEAYIRYQLIATEGDNTTPRSTPDLIVAGWENMGNDEYSATLEFSEDGQYEFTIDYSDKALREAEQFRQDKFYIDLTDGTITFSGVSNQSAYGVETVAPVITYSDNNIDYQKSVYELRRISYDFASGLNDDALVTEFGAYSEQSDKTKVDSFENFGEVEVNDGIYRLTAIVTDLAGRTHTESIVFSVNRFGSTYMSEDQNTNDLINSGYSNNAPAIKVSEINVTEPKNSKVSLTLDASTKELVIETDYTCKRNGNSLNWYRLDYEILSKNFVAEGKYTLTLSSDVVYTDETLNTMLSNRTAKTEQRNFPISFVVDKTLPSISITGVTDNTPYREAEKDVKIICLDGNIDISTLYIKINDELLSSDKYTVADDLVGEVDIDLLINADLGQKTYSLVVGIKDLAGNENEGKVENFTLSASFFTLFFHNTLAVVMTSAGLLLIIGLSVFFVVRKRRKIA